MGAGLDLSIARPVSVTSPRRPRSSSDNWYPTPTSSDPDLTTAARRFGLAGLEGLGRPLLAVLAIPIDPGGVVDPGRVQLPTAPITICAAHGSLIRRDVPRFCEHLRPGGAPLTS